MGWGDEVMVSGMAREAQERDPRKVLVMFDSEPQWHESWANNPRIAGKGERGNFQKLVARVGARRTYIVSKTFYRWTWVAWGPPRGELYFSEDELAFGESNAGLFIIEPNIKQRASPNKQWGLERWNQLAFGMLARGMQPVQMGPVGTKIVDGAVHLVTPTMRFAAAVMARARGAVLPEGGLHHVAAAVGTPAVVIFGGYIAPEVTGYKDQVNLFERSKPHALGCGNRTKCDHCQKAMANIAPMTVLDELTRIRRD